MDALQTILLMLQTTPHRQPDLPVQFIPYDCIKQHGPKWFFDTLLFHVNVEDARIGALRVPEDFLELVECKDLTYLGIPLIIDSKLTDQIGIKFVPPKVA